MWGAKSASQVHRMMACVVGVGFACLLRWADMALINVAGIYWFPDGCVLALPRRKNAQHKPTFVVFADSGEPNSLLQLLRAHCAVVAGVRMPREGRCTSCEKFVFRGVEKPKGARVHTWAGKRVDMLELASALPIGRKTYKKYLGRFREALIDCCGFTAEAVRQFGMHSMRVGGDTWLFENEVPQEVCQRMGGWASALSESTYIRTLVAERINTCKGMHV
jgi:hypothetical protein